MTNNECMSMGDSYHDKLKELIEKEKIGYDNLNDNDKSLPSIISNAILSGDIGAGQLLIDLVQFLHDVYNKYGESLIPDSEYDLLYQLYIMSGGGELSGVSIDTIKKYPHKYPHLRGTIQKIHFLHESEKTPNEKRKSYEKWIENIEKSIGVSLAGIPIRASLKVDGTSAIIEGSYGVSERVLKRGDTDNNEAENIPLLENRTFPDLKQYKEFGLKTELYMTYDDFESFKREYGEFNSPRSAITSIINSDEVDEKKLPYIRIYDLELYVDGKTIMPDNIYFELPSATDIGALEVVINELQQTAKDKGVPADGVVIRLMSEEVQELLGRDGAINKFEIAYKFKPERKKTFLRDVIFSMGKQGSYTPVAKIEPIIMNGNKISNVSLGSIPRLQEMGLRIGQPVYITYDVIPYLYDCSPEEKEAYHEPVKVPLLCSVCGEELDYYNSTLECNNPECPGVIKGKLLNWTKKIGVEGVSEATIEMLMRRIGIVERHELYQLERYRREMEQLEGYGPTSVDAIISAYNAKKEIPFDVFIGALGIRDIGRTKMKTIMKTFKMSDVYKMIVTLDFSPIVSIKGIGLVDKKNLEDWFRNDDNMGEFNRLFNTVTIVEPKATVDSHTILFTKVRDYPFQQYLEEKGYTIADKYTKDVDVVIAGGESSKTKKALKDGKLVMSLLDAHRIYKYNEPTNDLELD